ncbi:hypothetical protein V1511DRAFT_444432, partial [Dipodascopsis uninucleata]
GSYPLINWQHWIKNVQNEADMNGASRIPTFNSLYGDRNIGKKILHILPYYFTILRYSWSTFRKIRGIKQRVGDTSWTLRGLITSVIANDVYYTNRESKVVKNMVDEFDQSKAQDDAMHISINIYMPDPKELTRSEFQLIKRNSLSPEMIVLILFGLSLPAMRLQSRYLTKFQYTNSSSNVGFLSWESSIEKARKLFSEDFTGNDVSVLTLDIHKLSNVQQIAAAKAFGILPYWFPSSPPEVLTPRILLSEILRNHMDYLRSDNNLIGQWGGVWNMDEQEIDIALLERGMLISELSLETKRVQLYLSIACMSTLRYGVTYLLRAPKLNCEITEKVIKLRRSYLNIDSSVL